MVRLGDKGLHVVKIQNALNAKRITDHEGKPLVADGSFGLRTESAVKKFQASSGLTQNGIVDNTVAVKLGLFPSDIVPVVASQPVTTTTSKTLPPVSTTSENSFYKLFGGKTNTFIAIGLMVAVGVGLAIFIPRQSAISAEAL